MAWNEVLQGLLLCSLLTAASVWDLMHRMIPDSVNVLIACAGFLSFKPAQLLGVLLALPPFAAAYFLHGQNREDESIGGGDIKLIAAVGFVLGFSNGLYGMILGMTAAILWFLSATLLHKLMRRKVPAARDTSLPLAPFLSLGFFASYILNLGGT